MKMFPADIWEYPIPKVGNFSFRFLGKTLDEIHTRGNIPDIKNTVTGQLFQIAANLDNKITTIVAIKEDSAGPNTHSAPE